MSAAPDRLETPRLILRRPNRADARAIFDRYASDPEVTTFMGWPRHASLKDTEAFLAFCEAEWTAWPAGPYVIESRETAAMLGASGFGFETATRASTGYVLARDAWGRGYATEALQGIVSLAPGLGLRRLYAFCHHEHRASAHVLEKCDFEREGLLRRYMVFPNLRPGEPADTLCYARTW
jgi:ribosomal-protein-alanine N-acetyltransferase